MPEVEGSNEVETELHLSSIEQILKMKDGDTITVDGCTITRKGIMFKISFEAQVCLEFDFGDYAPDWDEP